MSKFLQNQFPGGLFVNQNVSVKSTLIKLSS